MEQKLKNHDVFLTKIRFQAATGEFKSMLSFTADCFVYKFPQVITGQALISFSEFLGDSDHFNRITPVDFCTYFIRNNIPFMISWTLCKKRSAKINWLSFVAVMEIKKELKKSSYYKNLMMINTNEAV